MLQLKNRQLKIEVIADILKLLRLGVAGKSEITYLVSISHKMTHKYLLELKELRLLDEVIKENGLRGYQITKKGLKLLSEVKNLKEITHGEKVLDVFHSPILNLTVTKNADGLYLIKRDLSQDGYSHQ